MKLIEKNTSIDFKKVSIAFCFKNKILFIEDYCPTVLSNGNQHQ